MCCGSLLTTRDATAQLGSRSSAGPSSPEPGRNLAHGEENGKGGLLFVQGSAVLLGPGEVKVWDAHSRQEVLALAGLPGPPSSVAVSADGKRVIAAGGTPATAQTSSAPRCANGGIVGASNGSGSRAASCGPQLQPTRLGAPGGRLPACPTDREQDDHAHPVHLLPA